MAERKKIVIQGGGANLYRVTISGRDHLVEKVNINLLGDSTKLVGKTQTMDDAISLIRAHSGREIDSISSW